MVRRIVRDVTEEPARRVSSRTGAATRSRKPAAFAATKNSRSNANPTSRSFGSTAASTSRRKSLQPVWVSRMPRLNRMVTSVE